MLIVFNGSVVQLHYDYMYISVKGQTDNGSSISSYTLTMAALGGLFAINLVAFVSWIIYQR